MSIDFRLYFLENGDLHVVAHDLSPYVIERMAHRQPNLHYLTVLSYVVLKFHEVFSERARLVKTHCIHRSPLNQTARIYAKYTLVLQIFNRYRNTDI